MANVNASFWRGKKVLVTGHTGFKGGWLAYWLHHMGAEVIGYSLPSRYQPSFFDVLELDKTITHIEGDIRDQEKMQAAFSEHKPEIVIHMAAQPLVRLSYDEPVETYETNVMGSLKLLECVRHTGGVKAVVMVTTDKCYKNNEWHWGYRECDPMGGYDPYSSSKGAMELMVDSYRNSFFSAASYSQHGTALASARAGNVIGGGDWSADRLLPDLVQAFARNEPGVIRNPHAIRPWQHVLQPLRGYLMLAERLYSDGPAVAEGWNFGPRDDDCQPVGTVTEIMVRCWGDGAKWENRSEANAPHEASFLKLDSSKAWARLKWQPSFDLEQAIRFTVDWYRCYYDKGDIRALTQSQIDSQMDADA